MSDWWIIAWWAVVALAVLSMAIVSLALFRDRSRGRRRCPGCWYDISATSGMTFPECGRTQSK